MNAYASSWKTMAVWCCALFGLFAISCQSPSSPNDGKVVPIKYENPDLQVNAQCLTETPGAAVVSLQWPLETLNPNDARLEISPFKQGFDKGVYVFFKGFKPDSRPTKAEGEKEFQGEFDNYLDLSLAEVRTQEKSGQIGLDILGCTPGLNYIFRLVDSKGNVVLRNTVLIPSCPIDDAGRQK